MKKRSRLRRELYIRWVLWLTWVVVWPVVLWRLNPGLLLVILIVSIWIIGGWFGFFIWGPGMIIARILAVRDGIENRRFKELNDRFSMLEPGEEPDYDWDEEDEEITRNLEREDMDMLYGYIVNEGGKGGQDYRVVPWDVRRWFPPYTASDGLLTLHESSHGVTLDSINPYVPCFGQPDVWAFDPLFAPDPQYMDDFYSDLEGHPNDLDDEEE